MEARINLAATQSDARDRLLAAALEQFTKRGYASTNVRELCEAAGVSKPVMYYYFKSKEGLYLELLDSSYALFESTMRELISYPGKAVDRMANFCHGIFNISCENKQLVRLIFSIYYGPQQGAPTYDFDRYYDRIMDVIAVILQEGIATGEIRDCPVRDMTWSVLSLLNTAIEEQLCTHESRVDGSMMVRMIIMLFEGIKAAGVGIDARRAE